MEKIKPLILFGYLNFWGVQSSPAAPQKALLLSLYLVCYSLCDCHFMTLPAATLSSRQLKKADAWPIQKDC